MTPARLAHIEEIKRRISGDSVVAKKWAELLAACGGNESKAMETLLDTFASDPARWTIQ